MASHYLIEKEHSMLVCENRVGIIIYVIAMSAVGEVVI